MTCGFNVELSKYGDQQGHRTLINSWLWLCCYDSEESDDTVKSIANDGDDVIAELKVQS